MEERIKQKRDEISKLYEEGKIEPLSEFARGMASGIQQTLSWLTDPAVWMDSVKAIPGLKADVAPDTD